MCSTIEKGVEVAWDQVHGPTAVTGSYDHLAKVWSVETGSCLHTLAAHSHWVVGVAIWGSRIATSSYRRGPAIDAGPIGLKAELHSFDTLRCHYTV